MPNMLLDRAPSSVMVGGAPVPVRTGWRTGIRAMQAAEDPALDERQRATAVLALLFGRREGRRVALPPECADVEASLGAALWFLGLGEPRKPEGPASGAPALRTWDWNWDAWRVAADFEREYGIDLTDPGLQMHWWRFWALFRGLGDTSKTMQAIGIRGARPSKDMTDAERKRLASMQRELMLPARTEEEARRNSTMLWGLDV